MPKGSQGGFTLIETLMAAVVLLAGLGGISRLLGAALRGEAEARMRMQGRLEDVSSLESGGGEDSGSYRVAGRSRLRRWVRP